VLAEQSDVIGGIPLYSIVGSFTTLMTVFKGHYKQQLKSLAREEKELINGLKRYYPEQENAILRKL
jgi:hypothetical protein